MAKKRKRRVTEKRSAFLFLPYLAFAGLILAGVAVGALLAPSQAENGASGLRLFSNELLSRQAAANGFPDLFLSSFFSTAFLLCVAFFCGLWVAGPVGTVLVALFKGAGIGLAMGFIYLNYGVSGFLICALFILPWALITSFAVIVACREGFSFSIDLIRTLSPAGNTCLGQDFQLYALRFVVCFGLTALAAVIQAGSTTLFSAFFFRA